MARLSLTDEDITVILGAFDHVRTIQEGAYPDASIHTEFAGMASIEEKLLAARRRQRTSKRRRPN